MPISNKIETDYQENLENTVYFYPGRVKISYSALEDLKYFLSKICGQSLRLEEKLRQCNILLKDTLDNLYRQGLLDKDHTMVITDPMIERSKFYNALQNAFNKTVTSGITHTKLTSIQLFKRRLFASLFLQKEKPVRDFINITFHKGTVVSQFLEHEIFLEKHAAIKFKPTVELEEYIVNILTRKALLSQGCSVFTLKLYVYVIIELVIWYARAYAYLSHNTLVSDDDLSKAIKLVDHCYIADPAFIRLLQGTHIAHIIRLLY